MDSRHREAFTAPGTLSLDERVFRSESIHAAAYHPTVFFAGAIPTLAGIDRRLMTEQRAEQFHTPSFRSLAALSSW